MVTRGWREEPEPREGTRRTVSQKPEVRGVERVKGTGCLESGPAEVSRAEVAVLSGEYWGPGEGVGSQCRPHCWASEEEGRSHEVLG